MLPAELWVIATSVPKGTKLFLWFWNPLSKTYKKKDIVPNINLLKKLGYLIYTFDEYDAKKYSLYLNTQVFSFPKVDFKEEEVWDFYFLGRMKDRAYDLLSILIELKKRGYKCLFNL